MPTAINMRWPGLDTGDYDVLCNKVLWEEDKPDGAIFHFAGQEGDALRVVDIWESPDKFQAFVDSRLAPAMQELGIQSDPEITFSEVHRVFAPNGIEAGAGVPA